MRLLRCLENIRMGRILEKMGEPEQIKNFKKLQSLERLSLDNL